MGWTARKSFKVMPGVRMTVSPRGVSTSVGVPGARISASSRGRVTRTVGLPGTGIRHTTSTTIGGRRKSASGGRALRAAAAPAQSNGPAPAKPSLFAPRWQKALYDVVSHQNWAELEKLARTYTEATPIAAALDGLLNADAANPSRTVQTLRTAWAHGGEIEASEFVRAYLPDVVVTITVADGVRATMPLSRDAVGLALAEAEQRLGNVDDAIDVVEQLDPSKVAAVSLCELYTEVARWGEIIEVTNGLTNGDDEDALLLTFRGIAFREQGTLTASLECFKAALSSSRRDAAIRHRALVERAGTYVLHGRKAQARKDLEKILAEDATYDGVRGLLDSLGHGAGVA